jgi:hypothetical protein
MAVWPKRLERQLRTDGSTPLDELGAGLRAEAGKPFHLGLRLGMTAGLVGRHGEFTLLNGDASGWSLLAAARRMRAYGVFLAFDQTPSYTAACALALLEALQWHELRTAAAVGTQLQKALTGDWSLSSAAYPSGSEIEALALHLLQLRLPDLKIGPEIKTGLGGFVGAAGAQDAPIVEAFEKAFKTFWDWCVDDATATIPRGARLSASPVFACLSTRLAAGHLDDEDGKTVLAIAPQPFAKMVVGAAVHPEFGDIVESCRALLARDGVCVD